MPSTIPAPLTGRFAIVTGASRGIGRAIALDLAAKGAEGIAITYAGNKNAADKVVAELKRLGCQRALAIQADLFSPQFGDMVVATALKGLETQELHIIVNNAGYVGFDFSITFEMEIKANFDKNMCGNGENSAGLPMYISLLIKYSLGSTSTSSSCTPSYRSYWPCHQHLLRC